MIRTLQDVFERALDRLSTQVLVYLPLLLVAVVVLAMTFLLAWLVRLLSAKAFKGAGIDRFLRETGFSSFLPGAGRRGFGPMFATGVYWFILVLGILTAINVFDTKLTSQIVEGTIFLFPKLIAAGTILLVGFWMAQYLSRSILIWASNEEIPRPRRLAAAVRVVVIFVAVVVAADMLDFAERIFYTAFVIFAGSVALAFGLALGLGGREAVQRWLRPRMDADADEDEKSLLNHL